MAADNYNSMNPQPQWNESNSSFMFSKDCCDLELKAFINFYMLVLWPNEVRCMFNTIRIIGHINYNMDKSKHTWNNDCFRNEEEFKLWFPTTIFPNGPFYDEDSKKQSVKYRAALDLLVVDFFQQKNMILQKTNEMGLCWFASIDGTASNTLLMDRVAVQTKGLSTI